MAVTPFARLARRMHPVEPLTAPTPRFEIAEVLARVDAALARRAA